MGKKNKKFLSLLLVFLFMFTYILLPGMKAYAEEPGNENAQTKVLEEGFKGTRPNITTVGEGWIFTHNGVATTSLDGYDSAGNFGVSSPSLAFGRLSSTKSDSIESPGFTLPKDGQISFWYKSQPSNGSMTSSFKVEYLTASGWVELSVPDMAGTTAQIYKQILPKEATKIKLSYTKAAGNVSIDDIVVSYDGTVVPEDTVAPVINHTPIEKAYIGEDLNISATVTDNVKVEKVTLSYGVVGTGTFKTTDMMKGEGDVYSFVIPKTELSLDGMEYCIEATDGKNPTRYPSTDYYRVNISGEDVVGPEIYNIVPEDGKTLGEERRPNISANYKDEAGVNIAAVKLYVDESDVTSKAIIDSNFITYKPEVDLTDGSHKVKLTVEDIEGNKSEAQWSFRVGTLNHYFGQLHAHTNISDGTGSLDEAYQWVKKAGADYYAVTDHSNWFDNETKGSLADGSMSQEWVKAHETADKYNKAGEFTAIYGYEMTWSGSTGGYGHMNTFNTPGFESRSNSKMNLENYYKALQTQPQSLSQFNHPGKTFGDFVDFGYYSQGADQVINLIEVGNGEGPIRGSGYFPSYEYYTRALDKGWHVAPTNNQDNHQGNWYTANNARTVIIASQNTRDDIYNGIKEMSVYASEDNNMTIDYSVNGKIMGSSLTSDVEKLNFTVSVKDDDAISKISVIANGGVEVTSKDFNTSNAEWNFELAPDYTYYYIKVVQKDQDIAVTAPVWVGEAMNVGLTEVSANTNLTVPGDKANLSVGVYNNSTTELKNVKVEFYENEITEGSKFAETNIEKVAPSATENTSAIWEPKSKGDKTIIIKATTVINGIETVFTAKKSMKVEDPALIQKVVIDGAHQNQYVSGNYAGKYTALKRLLESRKTKLILNDKPITDATFEGVGLFILTCPQSVDDTKYNLTKSKLEPSEIEAIKKYVDNGGDIIVTTVADYKDGVGEYSKDKQLNPLLTSIGTQLRINDDEVIDKTTNGGQEFRLYLTRYSTSNIYNLVDGIEEGVEKYSFYSGASVVLAAGASGEKVDFLVKGHETTATLDADKAGDNTPVGMGEVNVIGVEELASGGKVIVAGNTFFSDFETDGSNATTYSNIKVVNNILNWSIPEKKTPITPIADIRIDKDNNNEPDLLGETFTVEGVVTAQSEAVQPKNAFFEVVYIEDETGGICVFGVSNTALKVGERVKVTGKVDCYQGEFELQISDEDSQIEILSEAPSAVTPTKLSTKDSMLKENGGKLISVEGQVSKIEGGNLYINDGSGVSRVFVEGYIWDGINEAMRGKWNPEIKVGDTVSAVGLGSYDPVGARLRVRNTAEIVLVKSAEVSNEKPVITGATDITITAGDNFDPLVGVKATDKEDGDLTSQIKVSGKVDTEKAGEYKLIYTVIDSNENEVSVERIVTVKTNEKPVITGADNVTITVGDKFDPLTGVKATDKEDGDLTSKITVNGKIDTEKAGEYKLIYTVIDSNENQVSVERKITVKSKEVPPVVTDEKPVITGAKDVTIKVGDKFDPLAGIKATDKEDGDLTSKITVKGKVDTRKAGEYKLTYNVTDSNKNTVTITRVVKVEAKSSNNNDKIPQTGGKNTNIILGVVAVIIIAGGVIIFLRKKKEENKGK